MSAVTTDPSSEPTSFGPVKQIEAGLVNVGYVESGRAYHLPALPSCRVRVLSDWVNAGISGPEIVEIGLVDER